MTTNHALRSASVVPRRGCRDRAVLRTRRRRARLFARRGRAGGGGGLDGAIAAARWGSDPGVAWVKSWEGRPAERRFSSNHLKSEFKCSGNRAHLAHNRIFARLRTAKCAKLVLGASAAHVRTCAHDHALVFLAPPPPPPPLPPPWMGITTLVITWVT